MPLDTSKSGPESRFDSGSGRSIVIGYTSKPPVKEVMSMSKEEILKALEDEDLKKQLLDKLEEELEVEELEDRIATRPWLCYMPVP